MHELGIVFHIIKAVQDAAKADGAPRVTAVTLELGEVSGVVPHELTSCWDWAVKREPGMETARLVIETIPAVTRCQDCGANYPTVPQGRVCPRCGSESTCLVQGLEVNLKEIAVCEEEQEEAVDGEG